MSVNEFIEIPHPLFVSLQDGCKCENSDSCTSDDECLAFLTSTNQFYGYAFLETKSDLKLKITLPQITLITKVWWQTDYRSEYDAYILRVWNNSDIAE